MSINLKNIQRPKITGNKTKNPLLDFLSRDIKLGSTKLSDTKKERFYNQLAILFSSGIDLGNSLQIIIDDEPSEKFKLIYSGILDEVISGASFSEALRNTLLFSDYEYYSIRVGEESGRLQEILTELASYFELSVAQRRQLTGALSYPILVLIVAIGTVIFMLNVVVPMFSGVFQRFGGELPMLTRKVIGLSQWFGQHLFATLVVMILLVALPFYLKRYDWFVRSMSNMLLKVPFVGKLISKVMHARFCHSTALLTQAQVPLLDALEMVHKMIGFLPFKEAIQNVQDYILKGKSMHEGMAAQLIFERRLISLTKVGEEVNQIGPLYTKLYAQYTAEVKHMTGVIGNMLEPLMIIFVGAMVMIILIAMYLPLFQLSTSIM